MTDSVKGVTPNANKVVLESAKAKKKDDAQKIAQQSIFAAAQANKNAEETKTKNNSDPIPKQINKIINGNYPFNLDANFGIFADCKINTDYLEKNEPENLTEKEQEVFKAYKKYVNEYVYWQTKRKELPKKEFDQMFKKFSMADCLSGQERIAQYGHTYRLSKLEDQKAKLEAAKKQEGIEKSLLDAINEKIKETDAEIEKENKRRGK